MARDPQGLDPTRYPFPRASGSYVLERGEVLPLERIDPASLARRRVPLLAYGSNGSPEVLRRKLGADAFVPVVQATLHDLDVVYSSHISPYGSVPASIYPSRGTRLEVRVRGRRS